MDIRKLVWSLETKGFENLKSDIGKAGSQMDDLGKKMNDVGGKLTKGLTLPIAGLAGAGYKMYTSVDTGIRKVATLADKSLIPMTEMRKEIRAMSDESGLAQTEILEATYDALSSGVETADVLKFVSSNIDLTRAGFTDMSTAIDATTTVLNAYGDKAYDVSKIHDIFVMTQDKGKITVDELGSSIGRVIPTASALGVNLDQLGASYSILTAQGQNAQLATTNLNAMLNELGKTGSTSDKALRSSTGKSFMELTEEGKNLGAVLEIVNTEAKKNGLSLKDMFGSIQAGSGALTLLSQGTDGFNKTLSEMNNSTGITQKNAEEAEGDAIKLGRAFNMLKNVLIEDVGAVIAPYIGKAAEKIKELVGKFNALDDSTKKNILKVVGLTAAAGPLLKIGGKMTGVIGGILTKVSGLSTGAAAAKGALGGMGGALKLLTSPAGIAVGAVAGVTGAFIHLYNTNDEAREKMNDTWEKMKELGNKIKNNKIFSGIVDRFAGLFERRMKDILGIAHGTVSGISALLEGDWGGALDGAKEVGKGVAGNLFGTSLPSNRSTRGTQHMDSFLQKKTGQSFAVEKSEDTGSNIKLIDGSHRSGKGRIPYDGYVAELHKDEEVLTANDPRNRNNRLGGGTYSPTFNITVTGDKVSAREFKRQIQAIIEEERAKYFDMIAFSRGVS